MIGHEQPKTAHRFGLPPGKGIEAGAEHDVLPRAARDRRREAVLGKAAADCEQGAQELEVRRLIVLKTGDHLGVFRLRHHPQRHRIMQDDVLVEELMRGAPDRRAQLRQTGLVVQHGRHRVVSALRKKRRGPAPSIALARRQ